jgi:hypothetical protein
MTTLITSRLRDIVIAAGLTAVAASSAPSQGLQGAVVTPVDTFMVIVPARPVNEINQDIQVLDAYRARAKARLDDLKEQMRKVESEIELKGKEITLLESRQDLAENEKKEAQAESLNVQIEGVERIRDLLEQRKELYSAEVSAAEAAIAYASAAEDMYDKEIALAKKREDLANQAGAGGTRAILAGSNRALFELENSVLEAQMEKLSKQEKALTIDQDVVEQQQKLAEMQGRLLTK